MFDEYGQNDTLAGSVQSGYGWLGAAQRDSASSGLVLMGARLYNPSTGKFSSVDPVVGGNSNAYNYPNDPINSFDVSGLYTFHVNFTIFFSHHMIEQLSIRFKEGELLALLVSFVADFIPGLDVVGALYDAISPLVELAGDELELAAQDDLGFGFHFAARIHANHWWDRPRISNVSDYPILE